MKMDTKSESKIMDIFFEFYNSKKTKSYRRENKKLKNQSIVFFGDSITDRCELAKFYPGINALNRGISGNTTVDLLNRIQVSVFDANPSMIVLLIGINDMMNVHRTAKETAVHYEEILKLLREKYKDIPIVCQSVYPGYDAEKNNVNKGIIFPLKYLANEIIELNGYIKELCEKYHCTYADIHLHLKEDDNTMNPAYSDDGCHPNEEGYKVISKVLKDYLR